MMTHNYLRRIDDLLAQAQNAYDTAESRRGRARNAWLQISAQATTMANALSLAAIAAGQLVDIGNAMADDLNNVAGTFVQSDLMDE